MVTVTPIFQCCFLIIVMATWEKKLDSPTRPHQWLALMKASFVWPSIGQINNCPSIACIQCRVLFYIADPVTKVQLSLAVCPSGPCKNCSVIFSVSGSIDSHLFKTLHCDWKLYPISKIELVVHELPFMLQHDNEIVMFMFYFPLFIKLCMVLSCVIFKSEWHLRAAFWVFLHAMFMFDWKQPVQR